MCLVYKHFIPSGCGNWGCNQSKSRPQQGRISITEGNHMMRPRRGRTLLTMESQKIRPFRGRRFGRFYYKHFIPSGCGNWGCNQSESRPEQGRISIAEGNHMMRPRRGRTNLTWNDRWKPRLWSYLIHLKFIKFSGVLVKHSTCFSRIDTLLN